MRITSGTPSGVVIDQPRYQPLLSIEGGMGIVFVCRDRLTGGKVALKIFKPKYMSLRSVRELFLDEATNWILLDWHPNIVSAHEITQIGSPPQPCIVLECIEGRFPDADPSLNTILNRRKRRPLGFIQSLGIALGIARGMLHASTSLPEFIHCDLKPENILIDSNWQPLITDMGMSRSLASAQDTQLSGDYQPSPIFPCTPGFCAPEQFEPDIPIDQRTDIYALGCILFEMLTGLRINPGQDEESRKRLDREGELRKIPEALPASIRKFIRTCTRSDPEERYQDWATVVATLTACYREHANSDPTSSATPKAASRKSEASWNWIPEICRLPPMTWNPP
jgi:serine/threonine protein kinase